MTVNLSPTNDAKDVNLRENKSDVVEIHNENIDGFIDPLILKIHLK